MSLSKYGHCACRNEVTKLVEVLSNSSLSFSFDLYLFLKPGQTMNYKLTLLSLYIFLTFISSAYAQIIVSGNIESIPSKTGLDSAEVVLTNTSTKKQYAVLTDSLGNFTVNIPSGQYNKKVLAKNHFLYNDSMLTPTTISGNYPGLDVQVIENLPITETAYYNNILEEFMNISGGAPYGQKSWTGYHFRWKDSLIPIKLYTDSLDAPSGVAAQADSAIAELSGPKTYKNVKWSIQPTNATSSVEIKYVPSNQMPVSGGAGYTTLSYDNNGDFSHAICYISTDANTVNTARVVVRRELERALGLFSNSPDPNSDMDENGNWSPTLTHDDGLVLALLYSWANRVRVDPYLDSPVSSIDLPPSRPVNVSPADKDTLSSGGEVFSWNATQGTKPASYVFTLFGNGKSITKTTTGDSVSVDSATIASLNPSSTYSWTVAASDGFYPVQFGDTSSVVSSAKINNAPSTFSYIVSPDTLTKQNENISVSGTPATDKDGDKLTYLWNLYGPNKDTSFTTSGVNFTFNAGTVTSSSTYTLVGMVTDGTDTTAASSDAKIVSDDITNVVTDKSPLPKDFDVLQNYPNPFNPTTVISYSVPYTNMVTVKVYDQLGNEVATLVNEEKPAGSYSVNFNASKLSSGVYFYRMQAGGFVETRKLVLMK